MDELVARGGVPSEGGPSLGEQGLEAMGPKGAQSDTRGAQNPGGEEREAVRIGHNGSRLHIGAAKQERRLARKWGFLQDATFPSQKQKLTALRETLAVDPFSHEDIPRKQGDSAAQVASNRC